ncbi:MAG: TolC family protein [Planctomycetota bacterium]
MDPSPRQRRGGFPVWRRAPHLSLCSLAAIAAVVAGCRSASPHGTTKVTDAVKPAVVPVAYDAEEPASNAAADELPAEVIEPAQALENEADAAGTNLTEIVPAEPTDGSLEVTVPTLDEVVRSVVTFFPLIEQATAGRVIASGGVLAASGAFDHKFDLFSEAQPLDFYENQRASFTLKRETEWGGTTFAGYRIGRGSYEPWFLERETDEGGEFKAGFTLPVVRDRVIDANRSELWQAQVEQTRIEALIRAAVINAVRDGAFAYWEWVASAEKLRIAEAVLQLGLDRRDFLEKQLEVGEKPPIDLVDNRRIIVSREAKVVDARRKLQQSAAKLSLYLRDATGTPRLLEEPMRSVAFGEINDVTNVDMVFDVNYALSTRPEPRSLQLETQQLRIAMNQAANETWPDLDMGMLFGQDVGKSTSKNDKGEFEIEASLTMSVPLERRKAFGKLRQIRGKLAQVRAKLQFTNDKIGVEVQAARAALLAAAQRVDQTTEALALAERINDAERELYNAGQSTLFNLNIREQQAAEAAGDRVDALRDYFIAEAQFAAAMGLAQPSIADEREPVADPGT